MQIRLREIPLLLILFTALVIGLATFRDYGLSWDEPLYYEYGRASQSAYSISARLNGTFDIENSFGSSASDHVTRGPAYLLIGGLIEGFLEALGLDMASAWHMTNFLTYLLGLTFFYSLARLWLDPWPASLSMAFFAAQPVLWNHAFINPKDSPFSVFFLISIVLGFRMVDGWEDINNKKKIIKSTILPGVILGITTSIRFIAPYAVILLFIYLLLRKRWKYLWAFIPYGLIAIGIMVALWPFLWENPLERFVFTLNAMADAPANLRILFMGNEYRAYELPRRYFPTLLSATLTEPTWILFVIGAAAVFLKAFRQKTELAKPTVILLWFGIVITLLVGLNPPNSDGYRHYLFILPPVFLFAGVGIHELLKSTPHWVFKPIIIFIVLLPAIYNNLLLHPYQYAYYNTFVGGTKTAFRGFETDYWLTCYKEAVEAFNMTAPRNAALFVRREPYIAAYYTRPDIIIRDGRSEANKIQSGDYFLVNSRINEDIKILKDAPIYLEVARDGAVFCVIKQIQ